MSSPFYKKGLSWQGQGGKDYETGLGIESDKKFVSENVPSGIADKHAQNHYLDIGNKIKSPKNNAKARKTVFDVIGGTINKIFNKK
jgi:hypothetical protein